MNSMEQALSRKFRDLFEEEAFLVRSPGRVNIIGEHTDYNNGFVLPAAIDKAIYVAISKRMDNEVRLFSAEFNESFNTSLSDIKPVKGWPNYVLGVVDQLKKKGYNITGFNMVLDGNVPIGAGLSSSAAVECASIFALNNLFSLGVSKMEMVKMAQKAEHEFAGVMCGIMDQFASMFGMRNHAMKLDCRSLEYEYVPLHLQGIKIVLLNTNVKHSLSSSAYNTRRQECLQGVEWVRQNHADVQSLRDITIDQLKKFVAPKDELVYRRCKYVVDENLRLQSACEDLMKGNIDSLGKKMFQSHEGLSKHYEVSCSELDFLVNAVQNNPDVLGARMMGGGFGGCTINLVREEGIEELVKHLSGAYQQHTGLELSTYIAQVEDGTGKIMDNVTV